MSASAEMKPVQKKLQSLKVTRTGATGTGHNTTGLEAATRPLSLAPMHRADPVSEKQTKNKVTCYQNTPLWKHSKQTCNQTS